MFSIAEERGGFNPTLRKIYAKTGIAGGERQNDHPRPASKNSSGLDSP